VIYDGAGVANYPKKISKFLKVKQRFDLPPPATRQDRNLHLKNAIILGTIEQSPNWTTVIELVPAIEKWIKSMRNTLRSLLIAGITIPAAPWSLVHAQVCCEPAYSVKSQVVMEEQLETRYRVVYRPIFEEQEITSLRPVMRTRMEKRQFTTQVPVTETSTVEEKYTVMKAVTKREWEDRSYQETTYVTETAEREEAYLTYQPVVETQYQTQQHVVQRPITETQYQTQQYTTYQPVTTMQTAVVDQGQYVAQQFYQPGDVRYGLRYQQGGLSVDPTGMAAYRRGGFGWVPYSAPGQTFAQLQYQSNPVQVAVPQTTYMPQVVQQQVPIQVTRVESQVVQEQVPVNVTKYQPVEQRRRVPYSVQKPVTRYIENKVPVDKVEWVEQEMVRPKTVQRTSYKLETVEREVPVQFYETEAVKTKVRVPRQVAEYEPYTVRRLVPRTVQMPTTLSYVDPYAVPLSQGRSSWMPIIGSETVISLGAGVPVPSSSSSIPAPQQSVKKFEATERPAERSAEKPTTEGKEPESVEPPAAEIELSPSDGKDSPKA